MQRTELAIDIAHLPEVVSVELYWYGESSSDAFLWRARPLFAAVRAQTPRWARP